MSDPNDPGDFELPPELPDEFREMLEQLGGPGVVDQLRQAMAVMARHSGGPVSWDLARQVALQLAVEGDRPPTPEETARAEDAQRLAEHWLDEGDLPAPSDGGRLAVVSRQAWVNAALEGLRPFVEPVAEAAVRALAEVAGEQADDQLAAFGLDAGALGGLDALLRPMGGVLMGLQAGQVIGELSKQLLGQYDLGVPTADPSIAYRIAVNAATTFEGYELDPTEVAVVLALHEGAHRRQFLAVPWLANHLRDLVAQFAAGTSLDAERLMDLSQELMGDVDPEDPASLQAAMERATEFRMEPTAAQRRVLERLQGVVLLLQAWARHAVQAAATGRLPNLDRVEEVLRRRRATTTDGERLLANLLGLDLKPDDERAGDRFIAAVIEARGAAGLRRALAHPENLPDAEELAEPSRWLVRMAGGEGVPDDPSGLFDDGEPPHEPPHEPGADDR